MKPDKLDRLRTRLGRMEQTLLKDPNPDPDFVKASHKLRAEIEQASAPATKAQVPAVIGDIIEFESTQILVGRINHRSITGWDLDGARIQIDKRSKYELHYPSNSALQAAVVHRQNLRFKNNDDKWFRLITEGIELCSHLGT